MQSATADCYEAMSAGTLSGNHLDLANMHPEGTAGATTLEETLLSSASDEEKARNTLLSLGRDELEAIIDEHGEIRVHDDICNHEYIFGAEVIEELFPSTPRTLH